MEKYTAYMIWSVSAAVTARAAIAAANRWEIQEYVKMTKGLYGQNTRKMSAYGGHTRQLVSLTGAAGGLRGNRLQTVGLFCRQYPAAHLRSCSGQDPVL